MPGGLQDPADDDLEGGPGGEHASREAGHPGQSGQGGWAEARSLQVGAYSIYHILYIIIYYRLGQTLVVSCSVLGGRPSPSVTWWRESQVVDTSYQREESRVTNMLTIPDLTRNHLHTILTCQASNSNVSLPVSTSVKLDLTFPPTEVVIKGADLPLSAGKSHRQEF